MGGQDMGRYQVNPRVSLPKFISPKNPFVQSPANDASTRMLGSEATAQSPPKQMADCVARAASPNKHAVKAMLVWALSRTWRWFEAYARKLNPLKLFRRRAPMEKSAIPRFGQKPVQCELSLERVRVVRNDLMETDFEVVPVGCAGRTNKMSHEEGAWGRLATRIFGSETT